MATDEKERLSNNEFKELIPHLSIQDLLLVEYRDSAWHPMLSIANNTKKLYRCNLCGIIQCGKNTSAHIDGKKHKAKMQTVEQLFHPNYTYAKNQITLAKSTTHVEASTKTISKTNILQTNEKKPVADIPKKKIGQQVPVKNQNISQIPTIGTNVSSIVANKSAYNSTTHVNKPANKVSANANKITNNINVNLNKPGNTNAVAVKNVNTAKKVVPKNANMQLKPKPVSNQLIANSTQNASGNAGKKSIPITPHQTAGGKSINLVGCNKVAMNINKVSDAEKINVCKSKAHINTEQNFIQVKSEFRQQKETPILTTNSEDKRNGSVEIIEAEIISNIKKENTSDEKLIEAQDSEYINASNDFGSKKDLPSNKITNLTSKELEIIDSLTEEYLILPTTIKTEHLDDNTEVEIGLKQDIFHQSQQCLNTLNKKSAEEALSFPQETGKKVIQKDPNISGPVNISPAHKNDEITSKQKTPIKESSDIMVIELEDPIIKPSNVRAQAPKRAPSINLKSISLLLNQKNKENQSQSTLKVSKERVTDTFESCLNELHTVSEEQLISLESETDEMSEQRNNENNSDNQIKETNEINLENPTAATNCEVIVIDDENDNAQSKRSNESVATAEEPLCKKQKLLLNPAAAFIAKETNKINESEEPDLSRYISNKIIIPSKHKAKETLSATTSAACSTNNLLNEPSFSYKTISCSTTDEILGLIGVEYVIKILKNRNDISPRYECGLCELILSGSAMQNHLLGYSHRLKFCEKHFPSALRQYKQYMGNIPEHEEFKIMAPILEKLAIAIEKYHGRDLPYECLDREFNSHRHETLSKVYSLRHATEQYGPSFTHVIDAKEIDELVSQRHNYVYKSNPNTYQTVFDKRPGDKNFTNNDARYNQSNNLQFRSNDNVSAARNRTAIANVNAFPYIPTGNQWQTQMYSSMDNETHKRMVESFLRKTTGNSRDRRRLMRSHLQRQSAEYRDYRSRSPLISIPRRASISPLRAGDIWQAYRHLVDQKLIELNNVFATYRQDPEKHPMYNEEWQKFWKRRKDELIAAGLDHRTYNYQPEWVRFFEVRIEELYSEDAENQKIQCRERLCLPMTNDELDDSKYHVQVAAEKVQAQVQYDELETITELYKATQTTQKSSLKDNKNLLIENNSKVVAVLRLMTALEDHLGSLGPKIIDLLAKALQIEKSCPENIYSIILTTENCFLLETAMEKFKGLVIASLLEGPKERTLRKVILEIDELLKIAEEKRKKYSLFEEPSTSKSISKSLFNKGIVESTPPSTNERGASSVETVAADNNTQSDKKELAAKLAAVLAAKGKTDLNAGELQELVAIYTMFEKKKREAVKNISSTASTSNIFKSNSGLTNQKSLSDTLSELQKSVMGNVANNALNPKIPEIPVTAFDAKNTMQWANTNNVLHIPGQLQSMGFNNNIQNQLSMNRCNNNYGLNNNEGLEYSGQNRNPHYFTQDFMNANGNFFNNNSTNINNNNNNNNSNFGRRQMQGRNFGQQRQQRQQQQKPQQQYISQSGQQQTASIGFGLDRNQNWMPPDRNSFQNGNSNGLKADHSTGAGRDQHSGWHRN